MASSDAFQLHGSSDASQLGGTMGKCGSAATLGTPPCASRGCLHQAASPRSRFCAACALAQKASAGKKGGTAGSDASKRKAGKLSGGNTTRGLKKRIAGELSGGNTTRGIRKREAGKRGALEGSIADKRSAGRRSGKRRCAKYALVVKKKWLDKILSGEKTWEIRGCRTERRGWIHLAESHAGGKPVGRAWLGDCLSIKKKNFAKHVKRHCVNDLKEMTYERLFAWVRSTAASTATTTTTDSNTATTQ